MKKISMGTSEEVSLKDGFIKFSNLKKAENISPHSIKYYEYCFRYFSDYFGEDNPCATINEDSVHGYMLHIRETKTELSDSTRNSYIRGLRVILYYFMERGYVEKFSIKIPKADKKIKETYSEDELERLLKKPDIKKCGFAEYRDWVIVCYLLATGNRLRTICNVKISDLDLANYEIRLREVKNRKQYIIPLSTSLQKILIEYLQYRKGEKDDFLFCTVFGKQLTKDTLESSIRKYNIARGVDKTSIHLFRHTFAKNWILNGGDIFRLQRILGHSTLDMVKEYVNFFGADLKNNFDTYNPLENISSAIISKEKILMNKK